MTDTTDIKALRVLLSHEDLESDYHVGVTVTTLRSLLSKADQLEAERQRADANEPVRCEGVPQHVHDMIDLQETIDELRAEIASLKGEQVPVAYLYMGDEMECKHVELAEDTDEGQAKNCFPLFTAPQKLVVRPRLEPCLKQVQFERDCEWKAAIEAAGGIVKDGE